MAALLGIHVLWSGVNKAIQFGGTMFSPTLLAATRWTLVTFILATLLRTRWFRDLTSAKPTGWRGASQAFAIGALLFGPCHAAYYWALTNPTSATTGAEGTVLLTTTPLWMAVLGILFLGETLHWKRWLAIAVGVLGAYVVVFGFALPHMEGAGAWGRAVFLTAVIVETVAFALLTRITRRSSGVTAFAWLTSGGAVGLFALGTLLPSVFPLTICAFSVAGLAGFLYIAIVAGIVCFTVYMKLSETQELSFLALAMLVQPPLAAALDWLTGKAVRPETWIGTLFVAAALLISVWEGADKRPETVLAEA